MKGLNSMCSNLNEALMEDIIEITQKYTCMVLNKVITMPENHFDANNAIIRIAKEFEEKYPYETSWDGELDYIEEIEKYAEKRLSEEFGE